MHTHLPSSRLLLLLAIACLPSIWAGQPESPSSDPGQDPDLKAFVRARVAEFHQRRIDRLSTLRLDRVLARKNPYLLRAKSLDTPRQLVVELLDSYLTPQEAGLFGSVMEQIALEVGRRQFGARKSAVEGIDMEFERDGTRYIVSIKSGPNWGNSSQIKRMGEDFRRAKKTLGTNAAGATKVVAINGCCYGSIATEDRGDYLKLCGKSFWSLISGDDELYQRLIHLIGDESGAQADAFQAEYAKALDRFTAEFEEHYCNADGMVKWRKLVDLSSGDR